MDAARRRTTKRGLLTIAASLLFTGPLIGYYFEGRVAWTGPVVMQLQLGPSGELLDGSPDWDHSAADALAHWNDHLKLPVQFKAVLSSTAPIRKSDKVNSVIFDDDIFGEPFPAGTAAVTVLRWSGSKMVDADVVFNRQYRFNSYRGPMRSGFMDLRRVALHEFGHVLGLNHPDVAGQSVAAIMNSHVSDTEAPTADDIDGVQSLYGTVEQRSSPTQMTAMVAAPERSGLVTFPPGEDTVAFRTTLESKYRDGPQRAAATSFVDLASVALWAQEYVRYRVQACSHADAVTRTFMQMDGMGIQPVCGSTSAVVLPQRYELFDFRNQLEAKYRDDLRSLAGDTFVDAPGDVMWLQEYLRYRLGHCSHDEAADRVFDQIDGRGAAGMCR